MNNEYNFMRSPPEREVREIVQSFLPDPGSLVVVVIVVVGSDIGTTGQTASGATTADMNIITFIPNCFSQSRKINHQRLWFRVLSRDLF